MPDTITATCSALSAFDEPLAGTAAQVTGWVCLEFPGAWGRDVLDGTALGSDLARELGARADAAGVRIMFIRRPGRGAASPERRTVLLAQSHPARSWCERLEIAFPEDLLDLDLGLIAGTAPGLGAPVTDPVVLVCAHGKRDQCCAVLGRPVAAALAEEFGDAVWECSHTGGHRFAPSQILLPTGYTYGRLSVRQSAEAVRAAARGEVYPTGLRGRSCWDVPGQVAELAVRELVDAAADDLAVHANSIVTHRDGRRWAVEVEERELPPRPASCRAAPKPVRPVVATGIRALAP
ncbi:MULTISPECIES: sucrase ferredoxin [unclassified Rhodococcus (in: high G+C Gram-positive bacteria)]|uniref:sucrase ferredoxin n=1 Tax=unclassified Rhodococcus (in: high G+C Gram-positive bacteria) TaxID=192944 RepID=UPI00163A4088|nr:MULTISPECIES: sucrase ferredoxin [unclassified Rhodococcus (in: high G+C Gram-positive bacteria)]MBC2643435.1 sucrase ferredoxin [Rhodococcus sp. 3A]MBC2891825.1 sucrase ferredoxin [Rhodococcus sp. 4CII]